MELRNADARNGEGLNEGCGADFVQKAKAPPAGWGEAVGARCVSLDGDADRLVYFRPASDASGGFALFDGDRIAILLAVYVKALLDAVPGLGDNISTGVVQVRPRAQNPNPNPHLRRRGPSVGADPDPGPAADGVRERGVDTVPAGGAGAGGGVHQDRRQAPARRGRGL